jgi:uncharacterized membrane protein YjdF
MGPRAAPNPRVPGGASRLAVSRPSGSATLTALADMVRIGIAAIAAGFLVAGDKSAALKALLMFVPAIASRMVRAPVAFDLLFAGTLAVEALGTGLGVYGRVGWPDGGSHLLIPFVSAPIVYQAFVRLHATTAPEGPRAAIGTGLVVAAGVLALGAVWELVEWGADSVFGTDYSQGYTDTLSDLLADAFAASAGGVAVAVWFGSPAGGPVRRAGAVQAPPGAARRREEAA